MFLSHTAHTSCQEPRLNGRSSLSGRWSTYLEQSSCNYSGNQNPSCFQKTVETVLDRLSRVLDIALTVNVLVKHPRSGLPPTVLYNLSYLQLQLQLRPRSLGKGERYTILFFLPFWNDKEGRRTRLSLVTAKPL